MKNSGSALLIITVYRKKDKQWYFLLKKLVFQRQIYQLTPTSELRLPRLGVVFIYRTSKCDQPYFFSTKEKVVLYAGVAQWQSNAPVE